MIPFPFSGTDDKSLFHAGETVPECQTAVKMAPKTHLPSFEQLRSDVANTSCLSMPHPCYGFYEDL